MKMNTPNPKPFTTESKSLRVIEFRSSGVKRFKDSNSLTLKLPKLLNCLLIFSLCLCVSVVCCGFAVSAFAQEPAKDSANETSSEALVTKAWNAFNANDFKGALAHTRRCIELYQKEAEKQQGLLKDYPATGKEASDYGALNDVGASFFIRAEVFRLNKRYSQARESLKIILDAYPFSQYWDPKGWFLQGPLDAKKEGWWKISVISQDRLKGMQGLIDAPLSLAEQGSEKLVDYNRYGEFYGIGTSKYKYKIIDKQGLSAAVGEGIYPNNSVYKDPAYKELEARGLLEGSHWDFVNIDDMGLSFYKWASAPEEPGVKLFYTAFALEQAGLIGEAIKAYYAILIHYPDSVGWTYFKTPWYVGKSAIDKINYLTKRHPELGMRLIGSKVSVKHGYDNDIRDDIFTVDPGRLARVSHEDFLGSLHTTDLNELSIDKVLGNGRIQLVRFENSNWQILADKKPWIVKAVSYSPSEVGMSPDEGTLKDWMLYDKNNNGLADSPYDSWVDKNRNNLKDEDEPVVGDFQLLKEMGANTIRLYHHASNKGLLKELYEKYGIMVMMGDLVGMYTVGSGAKWENGTNYTDPQQRENMFNSVKQMVMEFKDEPYILMWVLGNENNYGGVHGLVGGVGNAAKFPDVYYSFINELAKWIHSVDPDHPVAISNGDILFLDIIAKYAPDIDIFGCNGYRGTSGFERTIFEDIKDVLDKPVLITEYGCPAYYQGRSREDAEKEQAEYHRGNWEGIEGNSAGKGIGNCIGGSVFQWMDEWWKAGQPPRYSPYIQETTSNWRGPFPGGEMYEEWLGLISQGNGKNSPYLRQLRKAYFTYQHMWGKVK